MILVAALAAGTAFAQDNVTVVPAPTIERFDLPPGNGQATPVPTPTPSPTVTPATPPIVVPTLATPTPTPVTPTPRPRVRPAPAATPVASPPAAQPTSPPPPAATPAPTATVAAPAPTSGEPRSGPPIWLWWAIGAVLAVAAAVLSWRRFGSRRTDAIDYGPDATASPLPGPIATPDAAPQPDRALVLDFRPQRLWTRGPDAYLAFELVVTNTGATPADAVRPVVALASAGPDIAAEIAAFQASAQALPGGEPFALRGGETRTVTGELTLPGDAMYVTSAADRELIVPIALVGLHWRSGLSLARTRVAFVVGTGDATTPRLGPIWVDRAGLVYARLDARRFTPGTR